MTATLGKYAVQGNHDKNNFDNIMKDTDFITLDNSYDLIYKDDNIPNHLKNHPTFDKKGKY